MANGDRRVVQLPGVGLACGKCGTILPAVQRTTASAGFVMRERRCPACHELTTTSERVLNTRPVRGRRIVIDRDEFL